jgi:hypothetical protein
MMVGRGTLRPGEDEMAKRIAAVMAVSMLPAIDAHADPSTASPKKVGLNHVQLRAFVNYKIDAKGNEASAWYLRFKEPTRDTVGYLAPRPSATVPDNSARFFSKVLGDSLIECFFGSRDQVVDVMSLSSVYCIQTANADGSGYGTYVEAAAACELQTGATGGGRTHFSLFNENRAMAASMFTIGLDCEVFDAPGVLPPAPRPAPSAAVAVSKRAPRPRTTPPPRAVSTSFKDGNIVSAANDETFMIETGGTRLVFKAKTYCFGVNDGDSVVFAESPSVCVSNTFIDRTTGTTCEVWCP